MDKHTDNMAMQKMRWNGYYYGIRFGNVLLTDIRTGAGRKGEEVKRNWIELTCDYCGCASHYPPAHLAVCARGDDWILTRDGKHFDSKVCYIEYKAKAKAERGKK